MRIWLPSIRARSGSDVYVERLAGALRSRGEEPIVEWFPHIFQYLPWKLALQRTPPKIDVINANSWIAFALSRKRVPLVATELHCVARRGYPAWKTFPQKIFHDQMVSRFERASFRAADAVIAISDSTRREVFQDFGVGNVRTIPLWVDTKVFTPGDPSSSSQTSTTRILIVGNMNRRKGGDLIGSFCDALGQRFEVTVVAGLRGEAPKVSRRGAALRFVSGLTKDELVEAYRRTDIVVSLSRHEGFGYTALEGMACGKPIVAFDVSGLRDVIADKQTGLLAPVEDVAALAQACCILRETPELKRELGTRARDRATTVFSEDRAIDAHLQLYSELVSKQRAR